MTVSSVDSLIRAVARAPAVDAPPTEAEVKAALAGRYSIERMLGEGGMGIVYLAREVELDRLVALKIVRPSLARDERFRARLIEEAKTAAKLAHPNIVAVHRIDEIGGMLVMAMHYVAGESVRQMLRVRGRLLPRRAMEITRDVARALAHAHAAGVVHRDIKPDNILVERKSGRVVVADFGIAAARGASDAAGTRAYMSPEQEIGADVEGTSDLYALGLTTWEMIAGELPARPLREPMTGVPVAVAELVERMLSPDPSRRPELASTVADELTLALDGGQVAPELRNWARTPPGASAGFIAVCAFLAWAVPGTDSSTIALPVMLGAYLVLRHLQRAPRLLRDGFDVDDLQKALAARADEVRGDARASGRSRTALLRISGFAFAGAIALFALAVVVALIVGGEGRLPQRVALLASLVALLVGVGALIGVLVDDLSDASLWERTTLAVRRAVWSTRAAATFARVVGGRAEAKPVEERLASATTALATRVAPQRRVHDVVAALERSAADARKNGDATRLGAAVAHIERIKLALEGGGRAVDEVVADAARFLTTLTS